ncbi:MAG: lamin tail domain-containing protein [Gracilimonas sp.]|uniref:lamin tail domain-containing protein n=1 Tax=Gracilimonas sp. TaxID=1974203 RepID=UPI00375374FA|nr:lamin tail domain-containing protein [Gracilimonas sp.]
MKNLLLFILIVLPAFAAAQTVNFEDGFSDGDYTANPAWTGNTEDFEIFELNGNNVVRLSGPGASTSYLSTPSANTVGYWEFFVRIDGAAPSGSNKTEIFLMSDIQDLTGSVNGYAVRVGETGEDIFRVVRYDSGSESSTIVSDTTVVQSSSSYRVKVARDSSGNWAIEVGEGYAGQLKTSGNTGTDNTYTTTSYFGFKVDYTSSRIDDFYFDFKIDIPPLKIASISPVSDTEVDITFSREIDFGTTDVSDFTLDPGSINPQSTGQQSAKVARLTFSNPFSGGEYELTINDIGDAANETTLADTSISFVIFDDYQPGDIIINEFMKDPPSGTAEYVELKNISDRYLNLRDWKIGDNNTFETITGSDFAILPDSFAVVSANTLALSNFYGNANYVQASLPALNNAGAEQVRIRDKSDITQDSLEYNSNWGGVDVAIERRDPTVSSTFIENWADSPADNFGTPGFTNQIAEDIKAPEISKLLIQNSQTIILVASERLENTSAETVGNYVLSQNPESGTTPPAIPTIAAATQIAADSVELSLDSSLEEYDGSWILTADNLTDIFGNASDEQAEFTFSNPFTISEVTMPSDSEILILFKEKVNFSSVAAEDFTVNEVVLGGSSTITQPGADQILIDLPSALSSGPNLIAVSNIQSVTGWNIPQNTQFEFFVFNDYQPGDIIINEFMKDPPTGTAEYVELKNISGRYLNLRDWEIGDNSSITSINGADFVILPDSFAVISADTVTLNLFYGEANYIQASLPALNNAGDQIRLFDDSGVLADSLEYNSDWGGEDVAIERRDANVSSTFRENWGDSPADNFGTPGFTNQIQSDTTPPEITSLSVLNDSTFQVIFSERIQPGPAGDKANYSLSKPDGLPSAPPSLESAEFLAPDTVILSYPNALPRQEQGSEYGLTIEGQSDIFGNIAPTLEDSFFLIDITQADPGDVVINEFMYDPGTEFSEFIELHNPTDRNFDLQGWTFNDNTGNRRVISHTNVELVTGSYVILAPDSTVISLFPDRRIIVMGTRFPSLNNGSDDIVIRNEHGSRIDSLTYFSEWGGNEISLERRAPSAPSFYRENWGDSPSNELATPGAANQIQPDNSPPELSNAFIAASDSIRITFNERVDSASAKNSSSYSMAPVVSIAEIAEFSGNALTVVLGTSLTDGEMHTLTIENQEDIFGNIRASLSTELEYTEFYPAEFGDVIVNEILYRRESADSEEFVELYNKTEKNFNLSNWTLSDAAGSTTIPEGTEIRSGEYLVLTGLKAFANEIQYGVYLSGFPSLNDDEDAVVIRNEDGIMIDSLFYSNTWGGNEPGVSLERKDPESASNDASNWASNEGNGTSAGDQSTTFEPDATPPQILFSRLQFDGTIFVAFTEFVNINNASAFVNEQPASINNYSETDGNIVILENPVSGSVSSAAKAKEKASEPLNLTFTNITDVRGNASQELAVEISQPISPGTVVINEILYNPLANSDDNLPDQTEYIELFNPSDYAVSLEGFFLHDEPDEDGEVQSLFPVSSQYKWIPAGAYVVVYAEDGATNFSESQLAEYFELENESDQFKARIDRTSLSLSNSDDAIYLADSAGTTIDSVFYDESWQNPNLFDTDGVALERIDPEGPSNDPSNWSSSTRVNGGTPGEQNSIFQESGSVLENTGITFTPNPFSPDDDGFEDNLFINYKLDESDYLLRVRIFDRYGREVRELADGVQAGFEGSLIWNGRTDDNRNNRVGIYIVLFEAYNSANGKNVTFKETVVLARKF